VAAQAMRREAAAMRERSRVQRRHAAAQRQLQKLPLGVTLWCEDCKRHSHSTAAGWIALLLGSREPHGNAAVLSYWPACAEQFGT
jgi:hypothetical protein